MSKPAAKTELTKSDLITIAEFLKFIRVEYPNGEQEVLELLDVSDEAWEEVLSHLNNDIKD